jgi:hypothetical protein
MRLRNSRAASREAVRVWTCCKHNDGDLGKRSAWKRRNGLFAPVSLFIRTHNETLSVAAVCLQSRSFARWNHFSGSVLIEAGNVIETHEHTGDFKDP